MLIRKGSAVCDEKGALVALWLKGTWYRPSGSDLEVVEDPALRRLYSQADQAPPPVNQKGTADQEGARAKIAEIDALGIIGSIDRKRT